MEAVLNDSDSTSVETCYQFAGFILNPVTGELFKGDTHLEAPEKSVALLALLLETPGELVGKYELLDALWPNQVVSEWSLSRLVSDTRQLIDNPNDKTALIKTIRGRGFCFNAAVPIKRVAPPEIEAPTAIDEHPQTAQTIDGSEIEKTPNASKVRTVYPQKNFAFWILAASALVAMTGLGLFSWLKNGGSPTNAWVDTNKKIVVLPVEIATNDDQDSWVEYGLMSVITQQLQRFEELHVNDVDSTLRSLGTIEYKGAASSDPDIFNTICQPLGCNQLLLPRLSMGDNGLELEYTLLQANKRSPVYSFAHHDALQAANLMLDHLVQALLPASPQREDLADTYSDNPKANQDYALGTSYALRSDFVNALVYLDMALAKEPDFFWAKLRKVTVLVNLNRIDEATAVAKELQPRPNDSAELYYFTKVQGNLCYASGDLECAVAHDQKMLAIAQEMQDPQKQGMAMLNLGADLQASGKNLEGKQWLEKSVDIFQQHGYELWEAKALFNLANTIWGGEKNAEAAEALYSNAADLFRRSGAAIYLAMSRAAIAGIKMNTQRVDSAIDDYESVAETFKQAGAVEGYLLAYCDLGIAVNMKGRTEDALNYLEFAFVESGDELSYVKHFAAKNLALLNLNLKNIEKAAFYIEASDEGDWLDPRVPQVFLKASYQHAKGNFEAALAEATEVKEKIGAEWTDEHDAWLDVYRQSAAGNTYPINDYLAVLQ